jgi:hypothetical protein
MRISKNASQLSERRHGHHRIAHPVRHPH